MDKINEIITAVLISVTGVFAFFAKRLFTSIDHANKRIDRLEGKLVDQQFLELQITPIRADVQLILKHLLAEKK
jgi:hypothetical protein